MFFIHVDLYLTSILSKLFHHLANNIGTIFIQINHTMTSIPDLMTLLCLDAKHSVSPFGGPHRTVLIKRDFSNSGDFAFSNFLHYFGRREQSSVVVLVCLSHDWTNYSATAAKCGFNLRRTQNSGNIEVINVMGEYMDALRLFDRRFNPCDYIKKQLESLMLKYSHEGETTTSRVPVVLIDDLSILMSLNCRPEEIFQLVISIDRLLRNRKTPGEQLLSSTLSYLVVQSMFITGKQSGSIAHTTDKGLNLLLSNLENHCDITITLKPLDTGHSTRVDGTIKIIDNRIALVGPTISDNEKSSPSLFSNYSATIGIKQAFFYKVSDRRVRLTSSALIF